MTETKNIKKKKCKLFRRIRRWTIPGIILHYVPELVKSGKIPFNEVIYDVFLKCYEGIPGIFIKPICNTIFEWEYFDVLYKITGTPLLLVFLFLSIEIFMKEHWTVVTSYESLKKLKTELISGGIYLDERPSMVRKLLSLMTTSILIERAHLSEFEMATLNISNSREEYLLPMKKIKYWKSENGTIEACYNAKDKRITILQKGKVIVSLEKGQTKTIDERKYAYLE